MELEYPLRMLGLKYPRGWQIILTKEDFLNIDNFEKYGWSIPLEGQGWSIPKSDIFDTL